MATLTRSITIDAPVEKGFDYALDIRNMLNMPDVGLSNVELKPDGVGTSARVMTHFLLFHMEMDFKYTEVVRPERIVAGEVGSGIDKPTWTFTFEPVEGGTEFTVLGEWLINVPAVGGKLEDLMVKEHKDFVEKILTSIKTGAESPAA